MRTASLIELPPSAEEISIRSAIGPRQSGPASSPSSPFMMPSRQPTLPALQSVSQPDVLTIICAFWKSSRRIEHRHDHQRVVRHDVAVARIFVVAVLLLDPLARVAPVRAGPCARRGCRRSAWRSGCRAGSADRPVSSRWSMSDEPKASASIAAHSIAAWTASPSWLTLPACSASRAASSGWPGATIAQPSMKICAPICSATVVPLVAIEPRRGRGDAALEVQPGGVLGRVAVAAPPQDRALLDDVVEPGLADLLGA